MKKIIFLAFLIYSNLIHAVDLAASQQFRWQKIRLGAEVNSIPVSGQVIAEEGALQFQTARVTGRILALVNEEGSSVKKGDILFRITGPECVSIREEKRIAKASNLQDLLDTIEQRQKELNLIVTATECAIVADSSGVLFKRKVNSGSAFNQGDSLAQILAPSRMRIEIEVPEKSASVISRGTTVNFKIPSLNNFKGSSVVQQVFPLVDEGTHVMKARLQKTDLPPQTKLNSMVFAEIALTSGKKCFIVPNTAITLQDSNSWVLKKNSKVERIPVVIVSNEGDETLINPVQPGALSEKDDIATHNVPFLYQAVKNETLKDHR